MAETFLKPGEWYDYDQAQCALVVALGLYEHAGRTFGPAKWVFWTDNPVGNALARFLDELVAGGVLERGEDARLRIRPGYDPKLFPGGRP
jgi:hypothetical protein